MFLTLRDTCLVFRKDHPHTWMLQVVPYLASFQDKWECSLIRCSGGIELRDWAGLLPCAWFEHQTSSPDPFSAHRVRSIHVRRSRMRGYVPSDYFKWLTNIRYVHFKVPPRCSLTQLLEHCDPATAHVTHLHLVDCKLTEEDFEELERMSLLDHLIFLDVSDNTDLTSIPPRLREDLKVLKVEGSNVSPL